MLNYPVFEQATDMFTQWGTGSWGPQNWPGMGTSGGHGFMWMGAAFWLLILGLLIWFAVSLIRGSTGGDMRGSERKSPLDILNERFARGEIEKEEYEEHRKILK